MTALCTCTDKSVFKRSQCPPVQAYDLDILRDTLQWQCSICRLHLTRALRTVPVLKVPPGVQVTRASIMTVTPLEPEVVDFKIVTSLGQEGCRG
jgi:hypothetical protein